MHEDDVLLQAESSEDRRSTVRIASILSILLLLLTATVYRNAAVWSSEITLWADMAAKSPGKARVHYNLGRHLYSAGALSAAEAALLQAAQRVEETSQKTDVFCTLGDVYAAQGNSEQALQAYLQVVEIDAGNVFALNKLGLLLLQRGKNAEAEKMFRRAILADPKFSAAYVNMGRSLDAQGKHADAASYFSAAKSLGFYKIPQ